jgi:hypothetical protein
MATSLARRAAAVEHSFSARVRREKRHVQCENPRA